MSFLHFIYIGRLACNHTRSVGIVLINRVNSTDFFTWPNNRLLNIITQPNVRWATRFPFNTEDRATVSGPRFMSEHIIAGHIHSLFLHALQFPWPASVIPMLQHHVPVLGAVQPEECIQASKCSLFDRQLLACTGAVR